MSASPPATFTARERWTLLGASLWLVAGLQLDAFAHATIPDLETFWTPWHAVMYSGIAACGLTLLWLLRSRLPEQVTYRRLLRETPAALRLPGIGMGLLLVGGGIDTLWHNLFGIERGLEIFFSPSHYLIIAGMVLVASGPALMVASSGAPPRLRGADAVVTIASAVLAALPVHIYTLHASALASPLLGSGEPEPNTFSFDAQTFHAYVGSTVVLLVPLLVLTRRWRLPAGAPTVLVAVPAFVMNLVFGEGPDPGSPSPSPPLPRSPSWAHASWHPPPGACTRTPGGSRSPSSHPSWCGPSCSGPRRSWPTRRPGTCT
nr:hypothetical protein GCM10025730_02520 [Promicromonospora thailandica]